MLPKLFCFLLVGLVAQQLICAKLGYAFSGGGARGFAHIGVLKVLDEAGIKPDYISGTSIGAIIGSLYAMGYNARQIEEITLSLNWDELLSDKWNRQDLYIGQKRWAPYGNAYFRLNDKWQPQLPQAVINGNRINLELFKLYLPASRIDDFNHLPIPFSCIATDLNTGEMKIFDSGSLMEAVRASMSMPSLVQPFPLNNHLYIDGGISQNLPGRHLKKTGSDFVIGFKTNSPLKEASQLNDLINVLDQTINISITNRINQDIEFCDLILAPDLEGFSATDFKNIKAIINAGERYAKETLPYLMYKIPKSEKSNPDTHSPKMSTNSEDSIFINRIIVTGNKYLSSAKIKEYVGLQSRQSYSSRQIISSFQRAWNSQLFDLIYPVLVPNESGLMLVISVKERERKYISMNFSYDNDDEFVAGFLLSLHNYLTKNSHVYTEVKLAGKHELNIDLVKNFGEAYGIYYRIFPYINEKTIYFYNDEHQKTGSAKSLEYGATSGLGLYAYKSVVLEGYGFTYRTELYRDISNIDSIGIAHSVSGIGLKIYHESVDDFVFPRSGLRAFSKATTSKKGILSDKTVSKLHMDTRLYIPINPWLSLLGNFKYGSHIHNRESSVQDPYDLGGLDGFAGFPKYEMNAPYYKLTQFGVIITPHKNIQIRNKVQNLNLSNSDVWTDWQETFWGWVGELGFKTYLGPIRFALAGCKDRNPSYYLSFGYNHDFFHFSRR